MKRILYWHRNDLRLHDNRALLECCKHQVMVVYVIDPDTLDSNEQATFLLGCLAELQASYADKDIHLQVFIGDAATIISGLCEEHAIDEIHTQYIPGEEGVLDSLPLIPVRVYDTYTLFEREQLPPEFPDSAQQFSAMMKDTWPTLSFAAPQELESFAGERMLLPTIARIGREHVTLPQEPGEQEALCMLERVFAGDATYADLEIYLQYGCISPRKVFYEAKDIVHAQSRISDGVIEELMARDYTLFRAERS